MAALCVAPSSVMVPSAAIKQSVRQLVECSTPPCTHRERGGGEREGERERRTHAHTHTHTHTQTDAHMHTSTHAHTFYLRMDTLESGGIC